jgi:hypothetical protein
VIPHQLLHSCGDGYESRLEHGETCQLACEPGYTPTGGGNMTCAFGELIEQACMIRECGPGQEPTADGFSCTQCPTNSYSPAGQRCEQCPAHSQPSKDSTYCRCLEGFYYDHWTPGLHKNKACTECVDETLCRTMMTTEVTIVEGRGRSAQEKAAGSWIHADTMQPLHCLPGNCISCDDYAVASGLLKEGQNLQQDPLPLAGFLKMLATGGAVKQNGRAENTAHNASSGPSAAAVCTGGSTACLAWQRQVVGTCCRLGHHGTLCAHCDDGWVKAQELCMPCQSFNYPKLVAMTVFYGGLAVYFWHKARQIKEPKDVDQKCQVLRCAKTALCCT